MLSDDTDNCPDVTPELNSTGLDDAYGYARIDVTVRVDDGNLTTETIRIFKRYNEDITPFVY